MSDAHARYPVLRLYEKRRANVEIRLLLVRMAVDYKVDSRNLARDQSGDIFPWKSSRHRIVARGLIESRMHGDDYHACTGRTNLAHCITNRGHDVSDLDASLHVLRIPHHDSGSGRSYNRDFHPPFFDDHPWPELVRSVGLESVRRQHRKARLLHRPLEIRYAVVVFMVAYRRGIVAHRIHRGDDRVRGKLLHRHVGERVSLEQIAGIHKEHAAGIRAADGIDNSRGAAQPPGRLDGIGIIVPAADPTVLVGGAEYDEVEGIIAPAIAYRRNDRWSTRGQKNQQEAIGELQLRLSD